MMRLSRMRREQPGQDGADLALAIRGALLLCVRRIGQEQLDPRPIGQRPDAGQVGGPPVDRGQVDLEVARMQDDSLRRVKGGGEPVGDRVGDRDELDVEGPDLASLAVVHRDELRPPQQARLLDAVAGQAETELGAVDRKGTAREARS